MVILIAPGKKGLNTIDKDSHLTTVRNNADLASLWKVMITLVAGRLVLYRLCRHL